MAKAYVIEVVESFSVSGNWSVTVDVTQADGVCAGEENNPPGTDTITVTATPTANPAVFDVTGPHTMDGSETWSWSGRSGDCPNGRATVSAVRP